VTVQWALVDANAFSVYDLLSIVAHTFAVNVGLVLAAD
jgi:hypothetical protein